MRRRWVLTLLCALGLLLGLSLGGARLSAEELTVEEIAEHEQLRAFLDLNINAAVSFEDRFDAEVWLVDMSTRLTQFIDDPQQRLALLRQVHRYAKLSQLPPELVLAVVEVESHFDRYAVSHAGAQGLMQVMPFWKNEIGRPGDNLIQTGINLSYGCRILQFYLQQEQGHLSPALARYNGSAGSTVYSNKVKTAWQEHWRLTPLDWRQAINRLE